MALITRQEVEDALERNTVGDVRPLGLACLDLLTHVASVDPDAIRAAEQEKLQARITELQAIVDNRAADTQHDDLVNKVASLEAELAALKPKAAKKPAAAKR